MLLPLLPIVGLVGIAVWAISKGNGALRAIEPLIPTSVIEGISNFGSEMISEHFSIGELTRTGTGLDNTPNAEQKANLVRLANEVLEPIRVHYGVPVTVSSAFRSAIVNAAVGGATNSYHTRGEAADIYVSGKTHEEVAKWLMTNLSLPLDEVIVEYHTGHLHLALGDSAPGSREYMSTLDGKTYSEYLG